MRTLAGLLLAAALLPEAQAFELNINKLLDIAKKAGQMQEVDEKQEVEIGRGVATNLLGAAPLTENGRLQRYVNAVGQWLAGHTERRDLTWHFGVLDSPNVNAFATPGGYIFVTRGLLRQMRSEAELAGVLAHEIAHVLQKHHLKAIQKNAAAGLGADVVSFLAQAKGRDTRALDRVVGLGMEIYARGLDRDDELEADRMGVVIASRAGYSAYGLPVVLQTLERLSPSDASYELMFKTHPAPAERLNQLDRAMTPTLDPYAGQPELEQRFRQFTAAP